MVYPGGGRVCIYQEGGYHHGREEGIYRVVYLSHRRLRGSLSCRIPSFSLLWEAERLSSRQDSSSSSGG